jgi:hypothetical protein
MSILNRPGDGQVGVLVALVRASVLFGTMPKQKLLDVCSPNSLGDGKQDMAIKTLNRWIELGLFDISDDGEVKVIDKYRSILKKAEASTESLGKVVREIIFAPENNGNFWEPEKNRAADFTRAASWMLAQNVHDFIPGNHRDVERRSKEQVDSTEEIIFQNDTRWQGYVAWATFLGFGRKESKPTGGFISDPTRAVVDFFGSFTPSKDAVAVNEMLAGLAEAIPVLDGGDYRKKVEQKLKPEKWKKPAVNELSTTLSRAILRLESLGLIRLEARSDSDAQVQLVGRRGKPNRPVTHVQFGGMK